MITPVQVRMARAALGWGVRDLAKKAGLAPNTVSRFENGYGAMLATVRLIQETLEGGGITFLADDAKEGPGVRYAGNDRRPRLKRR